jgi:predicted nucleic acid-binding protein
MRLYADPSALIAYYAPEAVSEAAERTLRTCPLPAVTGLTEVELFLAIARKERRGEMEAEHADRVRALFLSHLEEGFYRRLPLEQRHFRLARDWLANARRLLNGLDALHLAAASLDGLTLVTTDRHLGQAALALEVPALVLTEETGEVVHEAAVAY